jgi:hypothetical protein
MSARMRARRRDQNSGARSAAHATGRSGRVIRAVANAIKAARLDTPTGRIAKLVQSLHEMRAL